MNLVSAFDGHADGAVALIDGDRAVRYGELRELSGRLRGGLGVAPGDRVAIALGNTWRFPVAFLGVTGGGAVAVPLNPSSPPRELTRQAEAVGARAVIARSGFDDLLAAAPTPVTERGDDDLACLLFTAGTGARPKAAMLTHGNLLANQAQMQAHPGRAIDASDVCLAALPLHHIYGLNVVLLLTLRAGGAVALVEHFDAAGSLALIAERRVTVVAGVPAMWRDWLALPAQPFARVRLALSGAAPLGAPTAAAWRGRGLTVREGYGLTEASPTVTSSVGEEPAKDGSIGLPLPGVDVRLVGPDGDDALVGDPGEIWVRGPNVFAGYWEDHDATRAALTADGWLRTADIAVADQDGWLFIVDRATDVVNVSGFKVYPAEVEDALSEHPDVKAVAVVGVPHSHSGETVKAVVVAARPIAADELIAFCAARLARYKCPTVVEFVDQLPYGPAGKLLRRALR